MGWEYGAGRGQTWCDWSGTYSARPSPGLKEELSAKGTLAEELDKELGERAARGAVLFKCDFMDSDSQERVKDYDLIAQVCMKHKMMLNWHGARVPGGERRRWPHMIGYEGVYGAEWYKEDVGGDDAGPSVFHRLCLPFTRNAIGPMDYTGVTFTGEAADQRNNSDAAELAIAMLYETGFSYWGDHPDAYRARPAAMSFLKKCPSAWEDTKYIDGYPGEFVCLARKSLDGKTWFIGAMSNQPAREVQISLDFLTEGETYEMELHRDGADRSIIETDNRRVTSDTVLRIRMLENGGFCGVFTPIKM
jgi:alpha-glucosidase